MKIESNWSKAGIFCGIVWCLGFAIRYLFIWQDYSQAILFIGLGICVICISWLYDFNLNLRNVVDTIEEHMEDYLKRKNGNKKRHN